MLVCNVEGCNNEFAINLKSPKNFQTLPLFVASILCFYYAGRLRKSEHPTKSPLCGKCFAWDLTSILFFAVASKFCAFVLLLLQQFEAQ